MSGSDKEVEDVRKLLDKGNKWLKMVIVKNISFCFLINAGLTLQCESKRNPGERKVSGVKQKLKKLDQTINLLERVLGKKEPK